MPDLHREDNGRHARVIVEYRFHRGIRVNASIPIGFSVDPDRGERRRDGARTQHVLKTDGLCFAVEITHLAASHADKPKRESRLSAIDEIEINEVRQQLLERIDAIQPGPLDANFGLDFPGDRRVGTIEAAHAGQQGLEMAPWLWQAGFKMRPELPQPLKPVRDTVARDNGAVQRTDRRANHPIRLDTSLMERLVGTGLIASGSAAALHDKHDLTGKPHVIY